MKNGKQLKRVMVIGATSAIASETARLFAAQGASLFLVARNAAKLKIVAEDLQVRGAEVAETFVLDVTHVERHGSMLQTAIQALGGLDAVLIAHGTLPDQSLCEVDAKLIILTFTTNAVSIVALLIPIAEYFENRKRGSIAVITSVAGDRGRQSNYAYGSPKAAVDTFLEGLRNRLYKAGVHVLTIKPGLVDTPMTAHLPKNLLFARPEVIAKGIFNAMNRGKGDVIYLPWVWQVIMGIIKLIPERIFKRMAL